MSLLTKEQQPFEKLRQILYRYRGQIDVNDESEMLAIIDDLQSRASKQSAANEFDLLNDTPELTAAIKRDRERITRESDVRRQYTEQELVMIFQKDYPQYWQGMSGDYFQRGFREALRRVGALKAEP